MTEVCYECNAVLKKERDGFVICPDPDAKIPERLRKYKTRTELWNDLPTELISD